MKKKTRVIIIAEVLFLAFVFMYLAGMKPSPVSPSSGLVIDNGDFNFEFENARELIISTNPEFESPMIFEKDFSVELPPGTYYWKLKGWIRESEVRNFTIYSKVSLRVDDTGGNLIIYNTGNVEINVTLAGVEKILNRTEIEPGYSTKINKEEIQGNLTIEGGQS